MTVKVKICGLADRDSVNAAVENGASYLGFIFFGSSPRNIIPKDANDISLNVPESVKKVAVTVNPEDSFLEEILSNFKVDYFQLHGSESPERVAEIKNKFKIPVVKAIPVRSSDDVAMAIKYESVSDILLFDSKAPEDALPGGNGLSFNWHLLQNRELSVPWMLSGGLNIENIKEAVDITGAKMIDVSSSVESSPGKKDPLLISELLEKVRLVE